jgi:ketose-bisphosphate aldolase
MSLVTLKEILPDARRSGTAIAAFNVANLETLRAVVLAAEAEQRPVIVQTYHRLLDTDVSGPIVAAARWLAQRSSVPVVVHLDHANQFEQIERGAAQGFTSAMLDGSALPFADNVALTRRAAATAKAAGLSIEGEVGHVAFGGGEGALTDPAEAAEFAAATGVDALAVSIGTTHGYYKAAPKLDVDRAAAIAARVTVPLVLHGGSGTPEAAIRDAVRRGGIAKVNVATEFQHEFAKRAGAEIARAGEKFVAVDLLFRPVVEGLTEFARAWIRRLA